MNSQSATPAAMAYLGDAVCEICVRELLVEVGFTSSARLNQFALDFVRAPAQAAAVRRILPTLDEHEAALFRQGRNLSAVNVPRSATMQEYRHATGFEVLLGGLYLDGKHERLREIFASAYAPEIASIRRAPGTPAHPNHPNTKEKPE